MERRDFLDPRRLARLAGDVEPEAAPAAHLRFSRRAMATTFELIVPFGTPDAHAWANVALDEIDRLEAQLTVYRDSSEVSRLNASAHRQPVRVERHLFELLAQAVQLHDATEGAFDITAGALVKAWGFYRRAGRVPAAAERQEVLRRVGSQHLRLDPDRQTAAFAQPGLEINLGSIGKGYALDRAAALLTGVPNLLLHGGHSSVLARGREELGRSGWAVGVMDPEQPGVRRGIVHLRDRALATSAATYQHLEHEGRRLGHILDPRSGWPAEGVLSATVTAASAAHADALSTAFFILGPDEAEKFCASRPDVGAILVTSAAPREVFVLGAAKSEWEQTGGDARL